MIYNIIEVANTHGGSLSYIEELLEEFSQFTPGYGIKFQPFKYDLIASKDYEYYDLYKSIYINEIEWKGIIDKAFQTKEVWLDIFDEYGVGILKDNIAKIEGIKLQASVLYNQSVLDALAKLDMEDKKIILNIAGYKIPEIAQRVLKINKLISPEEILIEIGFQDYPTGLSDSGIAKLKTIKDIFHKRIVFADHLDGNSEESILLPVMAALLGADVIEKHVMLSSRETKFDTFSSVTVKQYKTYTELQNKYHDLLIQPFISANEKKYLEKTLQVPVLKNDIKKGSLITCDNFEYKRTGKQGLLINQIEKMTKDLHILATDIKQGEVLHREDFKKANIATIIACRLKSTRLPRKALLPIGALTSIELCIKNCLRFENVNYTILATSDLDEDSELEKYTYRNDVIFHKGHPEDVIRRYLDIAKKLMINVIIRVTGDCPYVSNEICQHLLKLHFSSGSDYTCSQGFAVGTSVEIINVNALERVKSYFPNAEYSEYMTWYFKNNPEYFKINEVKLPLKWSRNYRLTLDYEEDLRLFNFIEKYFKSNGLEYTIEKLFDYLDSNPEIANINSHLLLKYKSDQKLIEQLNKETRIKP
jgi:spore coat polysaccharide biosynthesis protein SpsF (cytidylyltransferase family)/sialic acid synthase SpsE